MLAKRARVSSAAVSATARHVGAPGRGLGDRGRALLRSPVFAVAALSTGFILVTALWLGADDRVPDYDFGRHVNVAVSYWDAFDAGQEGHWFRTFPSYPPLVFLVGALSAALGRPGPEALTLMQNAVFVPALVAGCYGAGRVAYGHLAGVLAAVFALGTPMLLDQFHEFMLDAPAAAMTALALWLILASRRFADWRWALAAGVATGLGLLTKTPVFFFLAGPVAVFLLRGGWRHWRGVLAFGVAALLVAGPWYLEHLDQIRGLTEGATGTVTTATASGVTPVRWSSDNLGWYFWSSLNIAVLAPLLALAAVGTAASVVRFVRERRPDDLTPELVAGALVGWAGVTYITLKDPRYSLPLLVYMAVLGTGWITLLRRPWRRGLVVALVAVAGVNLAGVSLGAGEPVRWAVLPRPMDGGIWARYVTLYSPQGYLRSGPRDEEVPRLLRAAKRQGVRAVGVEPGGTIHFNDGGLVALIRGIGMLPTFEYSQLRRSDAVIAGRTPGDAAVLLDPARRLGTPEPCTTVDGLGVFFVRPHPPTSGRNTLFCPR